MYVPVNPCDTAVFRICTDAGCGTVRTQLREVVRLFETVDQVIYEVEVETASGEVEILGTTEEQPCRAGSSPWGVDHRSALRFRGV